MSKVRALAVACVAVVLVVLSLAGGAEAVGTSAKGKPATLLGGYKHLVVIYEENHSFDNLYGRWGKVNGQRVDGLPRATPAKRTQVAQDGTAYGCLLQNDVNLASPPLSGWCADSHTPT